MGSSLRDCVLNALREVCELPSRGQRCRAHSSGRGCHIVGLKDRHGMKRWGRLSSRGVGASRESWNRLTGLGWLGGLRRPTDGRGRAKVRGHRLIERRHLLVPLFLRAVYGGEGGWRGSTQAGRVGGVPRPGEFFVDFREELRGSLTRGLTAPLAGTIHPGGCELAPPVETTPNPAHPQPGRRTVRHPCPAWACWAL